MPETALEKRAVRRFPLQLPIALKSNGSATNLQTRDVSARGICFYSKTSLHQGEDIVFTMTLPATVTLTEAINVRCTAHVVRVERCSGALSGAFVAAVIERYEFLGQS